MEKLEITKEIILNGYKNYVNEYMKTDELPSVFTFLQALDIDTIYISNMINKLSNTININKDIQDSIRLILNTLNSCIINLKELIIHKLINGEYKNPLSIIKILDTHYNTLLGNYLGQDNNIKPIVINITPRTQENNIVKI